MFLPLLLVLFTASGFAGLIYESIWSHYLKLFLGHAAYAQTLVLAIFMGGMALGAWLASRFSARWRNLLLAYAVVEVLIGLASLAFHEVFLHATGFAFERVIPALGSALAVQAFKWTLAALLILPQSVLLGMTFPLMTGGVLRARPRRPGYALAMLYFTNSLGAAAGVLASGFYFIAAAGLPGTLAAAAMMNLAVAALVVLVARLTRGAVERAPLSRVASGAPPAPGTRLLLVVAALTGLSSFMYEIGWIRMLSLVLGSSTHAFELMLAAFILGIAFGGLWIRRRIDSAHSPERLLGIVQLAMGVAAVATLPVYGWTFSAMEFVVQSLSRTDRGYVAFNFASHGLALAVMFPAAFFAGMTLPVITAALLRRGAGERVIGQVYAANTAGAIAGVAVAVHLGLPYLGLKGLIVAGAAIDVALGIVVLAAAGMQLRRGWIALGAAGCAAILLVAAIAVELDTSRMASGVFRAGAVLGGPRVRVESHVDGKTATVSVVRVGEVIALRTNGKSDGAIRTDGGEPVHDEVMMALLGALPQFFAPQARQVANIGFGTGMTTHVLLASRQIQAVDTIEIEPAMVRAGAHFRPFNARALDDPRSRIHYDDAKTYFSSRRARYDVIVSEPSNPWVSGVSSLFSIEFYRDVRRHLNDGGLLFQWIHSYEMTPQLLAMVLLGLQANFADYELWLPNGGDIIIVAAKSARVPRLDAAAFGNAALASDLARVQIRNMDDLRLHRMSGRGALAPYFALLAVEPNSDFFPVLDLDAPRARFIGASAGDLTLLYETGIPLFELFDGQAAAPDPARISAGARPWLARAAYADQAGALAHFLRHANPAALAPLGSFLASDAILLRAALVDCRLSLPPSALSSALANVAVFVNQHLPRAEREKFWKPLQSSDCAGSRVPGSQEWLRLYAAIGAAHPLGMAETAGRLLDRASELPRELVATALAARMAGLILSGHPVEARRAFAAHRTRVPDGRSYQVMFRFLIAQTDAPLMGVIDADVTKTVSLAQTGRQAKVSSASQDGIR